MTTKRIGLVLQGGAATGAYECGVIKALYKHYPQFKSSLHVVSGVSIGALNATLLVGAKGDPVRTLEQVWRERLAIPNVPLVPEDMQPYLTFLRGVPGMGYIRPDFLMAPLLTTSIYDSRPLRRTLVDLVDVDRINDSPIHLIVTAVDVETGELVTFENKNRPEPFSLEMALASGGIAPVFPMVSATEQHTGKQGHYWDGGFILNMPLSPVINVLEQSDGGDPQVEREVIVVQLIPMRSRVPKNMLEVINRATRLLTSSKLELDHKLFEKVDSYIELIHLLDECLTEEDREKIRHHKKAYQAYKELMGHRKIKYIVIEMTRPESLLGSGNFCKSAIEDRIECGYEDAFKALEDRGIIDGVSDREPLPASARNGTGSRQAKHGAGRR
jgi:NTE family protein